MKTEINITQPDKRDRTIKNELTNFVNETFFIDKQKIMKFITLIFENVNNLISEIISKYKLDENDIVFMLKGGNVLNLITNNLEEFFDFYTSSVINNYYDEYTQKSDFDFSIYMNPFLKNFDKIKEELEHHLIKIMNMIKSVLSSRPSDYFSFFSFSDEIKKRLLNRLLDNINNKTNENYANIELFPRRSIDVKYDKIYDRNEIIREINVSEQNDDPNFIYNSFNYTTQFLKNDIYISFDLFRSKVSFILEKDGEYTIDSGELIDISIVNKNDDNLLLHIKSSEGFRRFVRENFVFIPNTKFKMINTNYIIDDLFKMLFVQGSPWEDSKYEKRFNRLMLFIFIDYLKQFKMKVNLKDINEIEEDFILFGKSIGENKLLKIKNIKLLNLSKNIMLLDRSDKNFNPFIQNVYKNIYAIQKIINEIKNYLEGKSSLSRKKLYSLNIE